VAGIVIVGGGVIGCATAYYLAREGANVTLLERGAISGEASGAAAGMLAALSDEGERPAVFRQLCDDSLALFDLLLPVLNETGIDLRHRRTDILHLATTEAEALGLRAFYRERLKLKPDLELLEGGALLEAEPAANPRSAGGVLDPGHQYVDPERLTQALALAAQRQGARILEGEAVSGFLKAPAGALAGVRTGSGSREADTVLLAGGPWTMALARQLGAYIPVRPVRGQMLSLEAPPAPLRTMIWGSHAYLIPREDGQTYVGATVEEVGYRKQTTAAGLRALHNGATRLAPALGGAPRRRAWAGLRPGTPDDLPIMGKLPGWQNAWVSTGHFRNGILLAPISGLLLARSILKGEADPMLAPLSPLRFQD
jgi:glycine oxidase